MQTEPVPGLHVLDAEWVFDHVSAIEDKLDALHALFEEYKPLLELAQARANRGGKFLRGVKRDDQAGQ